MEEIVTIELFGQTHTFKADSEVTKAKEVADLLVNEVSRIEDQQPNQSSNMSKLTILMLAALNIANDHLELKRDHSKLLHDVTDRTASLIHSLENNVQ
ncbi:MAG: cell division protein ZapA [bacterium]|nr:cell division protein ZapA [bacterium]